MCFKVHSFLYNNSILHNFFLSRLYDEPHSKKHDPKVIQKNFDNIKTRKFYLNPTKEKSLRYIIGVPRYSILFNAESDGFLQLSGNQGRNKKIDKGKSNSILGPLQLVNIWPFKNEAHGTYGRHFNCT